MKDNSAVNQLSATQVLSGYSEEDREILSTYGKFITFREKATVIKEKHTQDCLYFVIDGTLKAIHQLEVGATPVGTIHTGEWFGEVNIFDPSEASADVIAQVIRRYGESRALNSKSSSMPIPILDANSCSAWPKYSRAAHATWSAS